MITDYYEGLRKAAEDIPDDVAKAIRNINEGVKYNPPQKAVLELLYVYGYIHVPLMKMDHYMTKTKFDPKYYNECVENDTSVHRGINYHADEIYDILSTINPTSAAYVIGKITNESGSYDDLCLAIKNQNKDNFVETMRNGHCHITKEVNNLCLFFATSSETFFSDKFDKNDTIEDKTDTFFNLWNEYDVHFESESINAVYSEMINLMYEVPKVDVKNNPQQYYSCINHITELLTTIGQYFYYSKFYIRENTFTPREKAILDTVTTRPEVANYFEQWRREFEEKPDNIIDKKTKDSNCWIKNGKQTDEVTWQGIIEQSILKGLLEHVRQFELPKKIKGRTRTVIQTEYYITRISAAMIYKTAVDIGLAEEYQKGVESSFERTMSPIMNRFRRQDMKLYMNMLKVYDELYNNEKNNNLNAQHKSYQQVKMTSVMTTMSNTDEDDGYREVFCREDNHSSGKKYREIDKTLDSVDPGDIYSNLEKYPDLKEILIKNYSRMKTTFSWLESKMKSKMKK